MVDIHNATVAPDARPQLKKKTKSDLHTRSEWGIAHASTGPASPCCLSLAASLLSTVAMETGPTLPRSLSQEKVRSCLTEGVLSKSLGGISDPFTNTIEQLVTVWKMSSHIRLLQYPNHWNEVTVRVCAWIFIFLRELSQSAAFLRLTRVFSSWSHSYNVGYGRILWSLLCSIVLAIINQSPHLHNFHPFGLHSEWIHHCLIPRLWAAIRNNI